LNRCTSTETRWNIIIIIIISALCIKNEVAPGSKVKEVKLWT